MLKKVQKLNKIWIHKLIILAVKVNLIINYKFKGLKEGREIFVASWDAMGTALTGLG